MLGKIQGAQVLELDILNEWVLVFQKAWLGKEGKMTLEDLFWRRTTEHADNKRRMTDIHPGAFWRLSLVPFV